jgi:pilus assembly protein CpaB
MDVKKLALLIGALVIAVVTAVMAKNMFAGAGAQQPPRACRAGRPEGTGR